MVRVYKISEICGDWALQIKGPGILNDVVFFKSRNNAELVKSILEWEDAHPNEAVSFPYPQPSNEALTLDELQEMDAPVWRACKPIEGGNGYWCLCKNGRIMTPSGRLFGVRSISHWTFYRCPRRERRTHERLQELSGLRKMYCDISEFRV